MKTIPNPTDNLFRNAVTHDNPGIEAGTAIEGRLNYYYLLKQPKQKVHANSFSGIYEWAFSLKSMGFKAGLVSVCIACFLIAGNFKNNTGVIQLSDTCQVYKVRVDTNYVAKDTCK